MEKQHLQEKNSHDMKMMKILSPLMISLFFCFSSAYSQTPNSNKDSSRNKEYSSVSAPMESITDSVALRPLETILNTIISPSSSQLQKEHLINDFTGRMLFIFEIPVNHMYIRKGEVAYPLTTFLTTFYKESYRDSGKLSIKVQDIHCTNGNCFIDITYVLQNTKSQ